MANEYLSGRTFIVTGAASGIGKACAGALLTLGANVGAVDRDAGGLEALGSEWKTERLLAIHAELSIEENCAAMTERAGERFGTLHGAVNCAGGLGPYASLTEIDGKDYRDLIAQNLDSVFFSMKHEIRSLLKSSEGGSIVNISSALGLVGFANASPYVASKHAIIGLTKSAALEFAHARIRVNAIAPGAVDTPLFRSTTGSSPEGLEAITQLHPMKRIASPSEIADGVMFLLGSASSFITGTILPIDGGWTTP